MEIISKDIIQLYILPHIPVRSRGFAPRVPLETVVQLILYRLKTGCQWRYLPMKEYLGSQRYSWQSIYYYFNQWSKQGVWRKAWIAVLKAYKRFLDMSVVHLDGSHTVAKKGGQAVGYQRRKKAKTTNALFLSDNQGVMLGMAEPQEGQHHDLYHIEELFQSLCRILQEAGIELNGLFMNADPGFDAQELRALCKEAGILANIKSNPRNRQKNCEDTYIYFDEQLYKQRGVIEHANAWMDAYKALLVRFETSTRNWTALNFMAFMLIFLRKIRRKKKV